MMRTWLAVGSAVVLLGLAAGHMPPATAQGFGGPKLSVSAAASVDRVRPGDSFEVAVVLPLPEGLHVNAHDPSDEYLIATEVKLAPPAGFKVGAVHYPKARERKFSFTPKPIRVYEGDVVFRIPVTVAKTVKPGKEKLAGKLTTQPCNHGSCFAPVTLDFALPLVVAPAGSVVKPANQGLFGGRAAGRPAASTDAPAAEASGPADGPGAEAAPPSGGVGQPRSEAGLASVRAGEPGSEVAPALGGPGRANLSALTKFAPPEEFLGWLRTTQAGPAVHGPPSMGGVGGAARLGDLVRSGNWLVALPLIFLVGLALNLTPCVYPLIPITVSYFGGQASGSRRRAVSLAALYVLGMALMYSTLGAAAAATGSLFGAQLQKPYVLVGFAAVMVALGLSMFGLWEIRLPASLTSRVSARAGYAGALVMGLLVGLVAAPCVGPAVVALLQVASALRDPVLGFTLFFALALGLGTPYLVLGSFSGLIRKLPRSGEWMNAVKHVFGLILFGMALYYLAPLLGQGAYRTVVSVYVLGAGIYLLAFDSSGRSARRFFAVKRGLGAVAAVAALWLAVPGAPGQRSGIPFEPYSEARIRQAQAEGRSVLIDFRADWCAACRELEEKTFRDPRVVEATRGMLALRKDLTNSEGDEERRLRREYGIVGLPHVVLMR